METSGQIRAFLDLLREAQSGYNIAKAREMDAEKETQDILHWLENNEVPPVDGDGALLVLGVIGMIRRDRRVAKDTATIMKPIAEWTKTHKSTMDSLGQLLGDVRKAEKDTGKRRYTDMTYIMIKILGTPDEKNSKGS